MIALNHFTAYSKTTAQSLYTRPCALVNCDGNYYGAGSEYLQVFDKATAAINGDAPVINFLLPAGPINLQSYFQTLGVSPMTLGLSIAISTTENTLTISGSKFDVFGDVEEIYGPVISGLTLNTAIGASHSQVRTEAQGPTFVFDVSVTQSEATACYLMLFARNYASIAPGDKPIWQSPSIANGGVVSKFDFGSAGRVPSQIVAGAVVFGCTFVLSTTPTVLTESATSGSTFAVNYKTSL